MSEDSPVITHNVMRVTYSKHKIVIEAVACGDETSAWIVAAELMKAVPVNTPEVVIHYTVLSHDELASLLRSLESHRKQEQSK